LFRIDCLASRITLGLYRNCSEEMVCFAWGLWRSSSDRAVRRKPLVRSGQDDAQHILTPLVEDRFPQVWVPSPENRDLRQLLLHRHRLVQMRTRVKIQLQAIAMNEGLRRKSSLWSKQGRAQLESFSLARWTTRRRQDSLELLDRLNPRIEELSTAIEQEAKKRPEVQRLMTHPGVGPITALAFALIIGPPQRFGCGKQIGSYLGLIPCEDSSADRQRLGHISKQGNALLRCLLVEAAQGVVRLDPDWRRRFVHLAMRRQRPIAIIAMARKLAVRLYWMSRKEWDYERILKFGSHAGSPEKPNGVK
jgi:transposase